jgi:hypothetical protein
VRCEPFLFVRALSPLLLSNLSARASDDRFDQYHHFLYATSRTGLDGNGWREIVATRRLSHANAVVLLYRRKVRCPAWVSAKTVPFQDRLQKSEDCLIFSLS